MTMTDVRAAALGEFPAPPPCPAWCETDHAYYDTKLATAWFRNHFGVNYLEVDSALRVELFLKDVCYGGRWQERVPTSLALRSIDQDGMWSVTSRGDVGLMIVVSARISPGIHAAVQAAAETMFPADVSSPEVTPAGEDQ